MAAATAFFATFALPPILLILIQVLGFFIGRKSVAQHFFEQLDYVLDKNTVSQIHQTLHNIRHLSLDWYWMAVGILFLMFVATTLFSVIKNALNQLWKIQLKEKQGIFFVLGYRAKSMVIILLAGVLFLAVLFGELTGVFLKTHISWPVPGTGNFLNILVNQFVSLLAAVIWFSLIFIFLADGRPSPKMALAGGFFTGLLFTVGKLLLKFLLSYNSIQIIYGASTSFVLLLLFIFYVSLIFYFGACFTKALGDLCHKPILPTKHASSYKTENLNAVAGQ